MKRGAVLVLGLALLAVAAASASAAPTKVARPTYHAKTYEIQSPYVVVHYTRTGPDHPRFMKDDDHDGVPNYVEKLAAAANKAWLYYGHNGFKAPLPDAAGPNRKVDIYVKRLPAGVQGVTIPASETRQGAFMVVDNQLDMAHMAMHGSLQQTVAHELFHLFQLSYVPDGTIPPWVAEGSATAMQTFVYPKIADAAAFAGIDQWLNQPWRSLYDQSKGCSHCYGGALWWRFVFSMGNHTLPAYFGRLYGYKTIAKATLSGLQPLDEILQRKDHQTLFQAFSRFSYDIYRARYNPGTYTRLSAAPAVQTTPTRTVQGLSTHYIPVTVPAGAKGIGITIAAAGGPNPEVKLVVGGPKGRVVEGVLQNGGSEQFFSTSFASPAERDNLMLIVTSGRADGVAYRVNYQAQM